MWLFAPGIPNLYFRLTKFRLSENSVFVWYNANALPTLPFFLRKSFQKTEQLKAVEPWSSDPFLNLTGPFAPWETWTHLQQSRPLLTFLHIHVRGTCFVFWFRFLFPPFFCFFVFVFFCFHGFCFAWLWSQGKYLFYYDPTTDTKSKVRNAAGWCQGCGLFLWMLKSFRSLRFLILV